MQEKAARALASALEEHCEVTVELRDDYSGRAMYGKTTYGISGDFGFSDVAIAWAHACREDEDLEPEDVGFGYDSMGLGIIIY